MADPQLFAIALETVFETDDWSVMSPPRMNTPVACITPLSEEEKAANRAKKEFYANKADRLLQLLAHPYGMHLVSYDSFLSSSWDTVRKLHRVDLDSVDEICSHCRVAYPCPTIRALIPGYQL